MKEALYRFLLKPSRRYSGGILLNILGFHVLRIMYFQVRFLVRLPMFLFIKPKEKKETSALRSLMKDGIVVIPNFLDSDEFEKVVQECESFKDELLVVSPSRPKLRRLAVVREKDNHRAPLLTRCFARNKFISCVVSAALRKSARTLPSIKIEESYYEKEDIGKKPSDHQDILHYDVSYPTIKCFFYLNDVNEQNAALLYARGSHKMTFRRVFLEYKMSIDYYLRRKSSVEGVNYYIPKISEKYLEENRLRLESVVSKKNTLVMANTMGFHRRGDYLSFDARRVLIIDYRDLETSSFLRTVVFSVSRVGKKVWQKTWTT